MSIIPGLVALHEHTVADADTAIALGSGDVPVLATPRIVAWAEAACVAALADAANDADTTTVGTSVHLDHMGACGVGSEVRVRAELTAHEGRMLHFVVSVDDGSGRVLAKGELTRAIVYRGRFLGGVASA
jgi:fluoroacetyl-CoA thioesterase